MKRLFTKEQFENLFKGNAPMCEDGSMSYPVKFNREFVAELFRFPDETNVGVYNVDSDSCKYYKFLKDYDKAEFKLFDELHIGCYFICIHVEEDGDIISDDVLVFSNYKSALKEFKFKLRECFELHPELDYPIGEELFSSDLGYNTNLVLQGFSPDGFTSVKISFFRKLFENLK